MTVLAILAVLLLIGLVGWGFVAFDRYTQARFQHRFFTKRAMLLGALAAATLWCGYAWWDFARTNSGDQLNGIILMVLGVIVSLTWVASNVRRTSVMVGATGSLLQVSVLGAGAAFGAIAFAAVVVASLGFAILVAASGAKPVYIIHR